VTALRPRRGEARITHSFAGSEDYSNTSGGSYKIYLSILLAQAVPASLLYAITCGANADYFHVLLSRHGDIEPSVSLTVGRVGRAEKYVSLASCEGRIVGEPTQGGGLPPPTPGTVEASDSVDRWTVHTNLPFDASERTADGAPLGGPRIECGPPKGCVRAPEVRTVCRRPCRCQCGAYIRRRCSRSGPRRDRHCLRSSASSSRP
jgi:hypothetical protein